MPNNAVRAAAEGMPEINRRRLLLGLASALPLYWEAVANLVRTPAPDAAAVMWKRKLNPNYLLITAEELAEAIAKDEAFLAAHPAKMKRDGR
ncbi:hypothetical protein [Mesorhizobium sp. WSM2239]|uniref:Uncharacterized protein n=2 Tax=unclassified Mesorhizobium TaxID=325217 RepID=A0AAU8D2T8_9HYPH